MISVTYSYTWSFLLNCCASSFVLSSRTTSPGSCAGASHFTNAEDTLCADTTPSYPSLQNTSWPTMCRPEILITDTPDSTPMRGLSSVTTGVTMYSTIVG